MKKKIIASLLFTVIFLSILSACNIQQGYYKARISDKVVGGNTEFAFKIFKTLSQEGEDENIFISPISISSALTMTYNGADTSTKIAMEEVLGFREIDKEQINESYRNLFNHLEAIDNKVQMNIGNAIWIRENEEINEGFIRDTKHYFNAEVAFLDFKKASAADEMNKYISSATNGKIDQMLDPPLNHDALMYIINAIYFKSKWSKPFDIINTQPGTFNRQRGIRQKVFMMNRWGTMEYAQGDDYKAVRIPYGKGKTAMYCILPDEELPINDFIENMTAEKWKNIQEALKETDRVELSIPRFNIAYGTKNLNEGLIALGMEEAFNNQADFTGIGENIYLDRVLHKAVIEVNEKGSEAAATTVVEVIKVAEGPMDRPTFIADRPFLFFITDDVTDTLLFMGKVMSIEATTTAAAQ